MGKKDHDSNCHGYTYHKMGITRTERFIRSPTLSTILRWFGIAKNSRDADVIAWVSPSWERSSSAELQVMHTVVRDKKGRLKHRMGARRKVEPTSLKRLRKEYEPENFRKILLARKKKHIG